MEILNIQVGDKKDDVIDVVQQMARLRGGHVKVDELVVVRTEDHQLAEAIVSLLGVEKVSRYTKRIGAPVETSLLPARTRSAAGTCSPADGTARSSAGGGELPVSPSNRLCDSRGDLARAKKVYRRLCPRCLKVGKETELAPHKQLCEECRNGSNPLPSTPAG
jgi:hypothetical protein